MFSKYFSMVHLVYSSSPGTSESFLECIGRTLFIKKTEKTTERKRYDAIHLKDSREEGKFSRRDQKAVFFKSRVLSF